MTTRAISHLPAGGHFPPGSAYCPSVAVVASIFFRSSLVKTLPAVGPGPQHCSSLLGLGSRTGMTNTSPAAVSSIRPPYLMTARRASFSQTSTRRGKLYAV